MTDFSAIRAISFDLDDTLWECQPVIQRAEATLYAWLQHHAGRITARYSSEQMREVRIKLAQQQPHLQHDLSELRRVSLRQHADEAGYSQEQLVREAFEVFIAARNEVTLFEDVLPVLVALGQSYPLVALTNGNANLKRIGIDHLFQVSICAEEVTLGKPDAEMFVLACERLQMAPSEVLHVGDDPLRDVWAAQQAGLQAVWMNRFLATWPTVESQPLTIKTLFELEKQLSTVALLG
ncbi:MAG: HAD-IA family hydrolase [Gammaproteobacteria bacterium]|nr:HAD-IA family hydrolase [Gammaproteobacteria bacterium]